LAAQQVAQPTAGTGGAGSSSSAQLAAEGLETIAEGLTW